MSKYASKQFWSDTTDRVIATTAQSAVAVLTADASGLLNLDLKEVASVAGLAGLVALLTSIAFRGRGTDEPLGLAPFVTTVPLDEAYIVDGDATVQEAEGPEPVDQGIGAGVVADEAATADGARGKYAAE